MKKKYYIFEMDMLWLQIISTVLFVGFVILSCFICPNFSLTDISFGVAFILMIPYMVIHEILHSISYVVNGAKYKNITYGAHLEKGILCCLCKQNISKRNILISLLTPFIVIGIITYIIGLLTNNLVLIILSIFNLSGCSGDLIMFFSLLRVKNFEFSEYDNPVSFGLYTEQDLSKQKLFGLKYVDTVDELEKKDFKKISISKASIGITILYIVLGIFLTCINYDNNQDNNKVHNKEPQVYYQDDVTIYTYNMDNVVINDIELRDYLSPTGINASTAIKGLLEGNENFDVIVYRDGGTILYYNDELQILICNKFESHKSIYISKQTINYSVCE